MMIDKKMLRVALLGTVMSLSTVSLAASIPVSTSELVQQSGYQQTWQKMVKGQKNLPVWARKGSGTSTPPEWVRGTGEVSGRRRLCFGTAECPSPSFRRCGCAAVSQFGRHAGGRRTLMNYLNQFFFDIYPYLAGAIFLIGSWIRYDYGQYSWRAGSSQMLDKKGMRLASNLFHIGILGIFAGHFLGMLTPHWMYESFLPVPIKQKMAMFAGGACGVMMLIGGVMLLKRRLMNPRVRATSSVGDILILTLLVVQVCLGLLTIPFSAQHMDGSEMMKLVAWAQSIVTFHTGAATHLDGVALIFKLHIVLGMTLFVLFPFCRLVHIWSVPVEYLTRRYQLVRNRH